jgi:ABC-type amino acid transport system permease subunit
LKAKFLRRDVLMQAAVLGALLLAMVWLVANVQSNLERQNIIRVSVFCRSAPVSGLIKRSLIILRTVVSGGF